MVFCGAVRMFCTAVAVFCCSVFSSRRMASNSTVAEPQRHRIEGLLCHLLRQLAVHLQLPLEFGRAERIQIVLAFVIAWI